MPIRKHNEFLDDSESGQEVGNGYDSDELEENKGTISRQAHKRRRIEDASDDESLHELGEDDEAPMTLRPSTKDVDTVEASGVFLNDDEEGSGEDAHHGSNKTSLKISAPKQVAAAQKAARRTGVIYISRVPPFMKPQTLRHFLAPHATKGLGRVFLTPEDHAAHTRRVKSGGNKKKSFTDGWVEFVSKREARIAAETLNGNIIGGKKGNFYHDDLWSMKYLKGFKWSHLTEQIASENAERAVRMREEVRKTRKENKAFMEDVERGKMLETMEAKRQARREKGIVDDAAAGTTRKIARPKQFKQKAVRLAQDSDKPSEQVSRMQRMIF